MVFMYNFVTAKQTKFQDFNFVCVAGQQLYSNLPTLVHAAGFESLFGENCMDNRNRLSIQLYLSKRFCTKVSYLD